MNSGDRAGSIAMGFGSAAVVAIAFLMSSCMARETAARQPAEILRLKTEHVQKMTCIQQRGEWKHIDYADTCVFK